MEVKEVGLHVPTFLTKPKEVIASLVHLFILFLEEMLYGKGIDNKDMRFLYNNQLFFLEHCFFMKKQWQIIIQTYLFLVDLSCPLDR